MKQKVACLMSGGVDSSVACAILKEKGFDVMGFTLKLWSGGGRCCNTKDIDDAKKVSATLKVPHYIIDLKSEFKKNVIDYFVSEYMKGKTPNPCVVCNQKIKFGTFIEKMDKLGIKYIATGHYAKIGIIKGRYLLKKAKESLKDQSYFLACLNQESLSRIIFPLADLRKTDVRKKAAELKLKVSDKKESQEICFIPDDNITGFISGIKKVSPGQIVNKNGDILGCHQGIINYTIGQRKGIRLPGPKPLYVIKIENRKNRIIVGGVEDLYSTEMSVARLHWISIKEIKAPLSIEVKIRYNQIPSPATLVPIDKNNATVNFNIPRRAVTSGQLAVFYKGDIVVGSGWIKA